MEDLGNKFIDKVYEVLGAYIGVVWCRERWFAYRCKMHIPRGVTEDGTELVYTTDLFP